MDKYVKRTQRDYNMSFKLNVVKEIESGSLSTAGTCKKYVIQITPSNIIFIFV
ncbi:MAG: hypothetical protein Q4B43_08840 [Bacteroidota bacterium]|nr:hypothetical protein [Bacteroidota bacterium]